MNNGTATAAGPSGSVVGGAVLAVGVVVEVVGSVVVDVVVVVVVDVVDVSVGPGFDASSVVQAARTASAAVVSATRRREIIG